MAKTKHDFGTARRFFPALSLALDSDATVAMLLTTLLELEKEDGEPFRVTIAELCERLGIRPRGVKRARDVLVAAKLIVSKGLGREGVLVTVQHRTIKRWWAEQQNRGGKPSPSADQVRNGPDDRVRFVPVEEVRNGLDDDGGVVAIEKTRLPLGPVEKMVVVGGVGRGFSGEANRPESAKPSGSGNVPFSRSDACAREGGDPTPGPPPKARPPRVKAPPKTAAVAPEPPAPPEPLALVPFVPQPPVEHPEKAAKREAAIAKRAKAQNNNRYRVHPSDVSRAEALAWLNGRYDNEPLGTERLDELMRMLVAMRASVQGLTNGADFDGGDCAFVRICLKAWKPSELLIAVKGSQAAERWEGRSPTLKAILKDPAPCIAAAMKPSPRNKKGAAVALYNATREEFELRCMQWDIRKVPKIESPSMKVPEELLADVAKMRALIDDTTNKNPEALVASAKEVR